MNSELYEKRQLSGRVALAHVESQIDSEREWQRGKAPKDRAKKCVTETLRQSETK